MYLWNFYQQTIFDLGILNKSFQLQRVFLPLLILYICVKKCWVLIRITSIKLIYLENIKWPKITRTWNAKLFETENEIGKQRTCYKVWKSNKKITDFEILFECIHGKIRIKQKDAEKEIQTIIRLFSQSTSVLAELDISVEVRVFDGVNKVIKARELSEQQTWTTTSLME